MAKSSDVLGGFDFDFVDNPIPPRYLCNICMRVLRDARLTECCGKHFCDSCLATWMKQQKTCPICRKEKFRSMINKDINREVKELHIRCKYRERGCDWEGEMGALDNHLKRCGYVKVECTNVGKANKQCGELLERRNLTNHKKNKCKYRPYTCEYCGRKDTFEGIALGYKKQSVLGFAFPVLSHHEECDKYPLVCQNKCGKGNIKREDMKAHRDICPLEPLNCPFNAGHKNILRKDMESHKKKECDYRPYSCEYCGHRGTFRNIKGIKGGTNHYDNCDQYPLECRNKCGAKRVKRSEMKAHCDICPLQPLKCPFNAKVCRKNILRKDMESHKRECEYRPYSCEYCGCDGTFRDIQGSHYSICDQYPLKCPNKCGETNIKGRDVKAHCDICLLEPVKCPINAKLCCKDILRKDMESHKRECDYRPYSCEYCGHRGTFRDIHSHYENCDEYPLECPNKCGETNIKRRDMKEHRDICSLEPLDCPFNDVGCTDKIQRKDMKEHIESNTQEHLTMAFKSYQELKKANQELKEANQELMKANRETRGGLIFFLILYMLLYNIILLFFSFV